MRSAFFTFGFLFLIAFSSCEGDQYVRFKYTGLDVANVNSAPGIPVVDGSDSIKKEIYGIRLFLFPVETERKGRYFDDHESGVSAEDPIRDIDIICSDSFDIDHPAGSDVTNCFTYLAGNYFHMFPLNDGSGFSPTAKYQHDYADHNFPERADLLLTRMPDNTAYRKFIVRLKYVSGYARTDSTALVKLY